MFILYNKILLPIILIIFRNLAQEKLFMNENWKLEKKKR